MKLGSLFDGSGCFPLVATMCGIEPVWASEVEPYPIAVTRSRFPNMKHIGDVTKVNGAEIEPVDVLTFGFPCQDISVAGKRKGVKHTDKGDEQTTRSGLFHEAVRIIKEMREATNGVYPRIVIFENVPGLFSSEKGEDFRTVCEEIIKIKEPSAVMPSVPEGGWAYADTYCGDGFSVAYRVLDAQYIRTAQRRRRIFFVADFGGQCASEILFKRSCLRGYSTESGTERKGIAEDVGNSTTADDRTGCMTQGFPLGFRPENVRLYDEKATTICNGTRAGFCNGVVVGVDAYNGDLTGGVSSTLGVNCGVSTGRNGVIEYRGYPAVEPLSIENHPADSRVNIDESGKVQTLTSRMGTGGGNVPMVMEPIAIDRVAFNQGKNAKYDIEISDEGKTSPLVARGPSAVSYCDGGSVCGTLTKNNAGGNQRMPDKMNFNCVIEQSPKYIVRRLTPTECARLQGFPDRWGDIDHKTDFADEEYGFWNNVRKTHAEINGNSVKDWTNKQMLTWYNKLHSDSSEYKMWGNGIALPCALYVMEGVEDVLRRSKNV